MSRTKAIARRLRRIYLYLFGVQVLAWVFKLRQAPTPAGSFEEWMSRAATGAVPGAWVVTLVGCGFAFAIAVALLWGGVHNEDSALAEALRATRHEA